MSSTQIKPGGPHTVGGVSGTGSHQLAGMGSVEIELELEDTMNGTLFYGGS